MLHMITMSSVNASIVQGIEQWPSYGWGVRNSLLLISTKHPFTCLIRKRFVSLRYEFLI